MIRKKMNRSIDRKVFRSTANNVKRINYGLTFRGGIRL